MSFLAVIFGYFFVPELKNRSLEEVERMFEAGVPLRKFGQYQSDAGDIGAMLTKLEQHDIRESHGAKVDLPQKQG